jgi:hypothetical protein
MCRPHKEIARDIAMLGGAAIEPHYDQPRSADTQFDAARYYVAMLAVSELRIEQVMPALYGNSFYDPNTLVTSKAKEALAEAGIAVNKSCPHATQRGIKAYRDAHIETLRAALDATADYLRANGSDLTREDLGLPLLPDDPAENGPFLDDAVVRLFDGYDDQAMSYASQPLTVSRKSHSPEFEPLRAATAYFVALPDVRSILGQLFPNKLVELIRKAPEEVKLGLGQQIDCVMCHHDDPAGPGL